MNPLTTLLFLAILSGLSLCLYLILNLLDLLKTAAKQKIWILQLGSLMILSAPLIFAVLHSASLQTIELPSFPVSIDPLSPHSSAAPLLHQDRSWYSLLLIAYVLGAGLMLARLLYRYFLTQKWLSDSTLGEVQGQQVFLSQKIVSPLSFGFLKPRIFILNGQPGKYI